MFLALVKKLLKIQPHPCFQACVAYANNKKICVKGHVVERSSNISSTSKSLSFWRPLRRLLRHYLAKGIEGIPVVLYDGHSRHVQFTGRGGYFCFEIENREEQRPFVRLGIEECALYVHVPLCFSHEKMPYVVVSDVDDTVLKTHATRWWQRLKYLLFYDVHERKAIPGMQALYTFLNAAGECPPLFFYVSNSEWNLFDLIRDFLKINHFPDGCLLLRERVHHWRELFRKKESHKHATIEHLMDMYALPFLLIGDSGQQDPLIYARLVEHHPGRIKGVYLRLIKEKHRHTPRLKHLEAVCNARGVFCRVFTDPEACL
jgi:phosphatidate phosphatase APP1